jgi:DNA-binding GntR family transcriptional regulator
MIDAVEAKDAEKLVTLMDNHRGATRQMLQDMLGSSLSAALLSLPQTAPPAA